MVVRFNKNAPIICHFQIDWQINFQRTKYCRNASLGRFYGLLVTILCAFETIPETNWKQRFTSFTKMTMTSKPNFVEVLQITFDCWKSLRCRTNLIDAQYYVLIHAIFECFGLHCCILAVLTLNCCCCLLYNFSWLLFGVRGLLFQLL